MHRIINDNIDKIKTLCDNHKVRSLFAFGSVCTDKFSDKSDIDLLISFYSMDYGDYADNYFIVADKFEQIFHRPVDLIYVYVEHIVNRVPSPQDEYAGHPGEYHVPERLKRSPCHERGR